MLEVDRQRFERLAPDRRPARADRRQSPATPRRPDRDGRRAGTAPPARVTHPRVSRPHPGRARTARVQPRRGNRTPRPPVSVAAFEQPAGAQALACAARRMRRAGQQAHGTGRERGQRNQVEPVVLEHRLERRGVAGPHEVEVPPRNLVTGHVANPPHAEQRPLEHAQAAAVGLGPRAWGRAGSAPEPARRVQHVHVGDAAKRRRQPVELVPRLEHRHVERLAVVADQRRRRVASAPPPRPAAAVRAGRPAGNTAGRGTRAARRTRTRRETRTCRRPPARPVVSRSRKSSGRGARSSDSGTPPSSDNSGAAASAQPGTSPMRSRPC